MDLRKFSKVGTIIALAASLVACGGNNAKNATAEETATNNAAETAQTETAAATGGINVISREQGSGTRSAFTELTGVLVKEGDEEVDKTYEEAAVQSSTDAVLTTVQNDAQAIGYISLGSLNDSVKAVNVEGVVASADDIKNGSYKLARPFNVAYKADVDEKAKDLITFIMSDEGQKIVEEEGYVGDAKGETYTAIDNDAHITIAGSTSVSPLMEKLVEAYKALNPKVQIDIQSNGSSAGMTAATEGTAQLGMASRELKDEEKANLEFTVIARDGIAVIVNKENPTEDLTMEQLRQIFTGEVTEWDSL
ncbi:phosphate ABC transporter substrate-binding protein [Ignatzschineria cameli]|uniref:substrate-binding domain-containing protein n=1 Tax=Ignatzschineria cameli TaxID=2182793 RepID=UPI000D61F4CE|nr:substrate-binding domain-containing protein [Ignatzschineria cameli]PWD88355.1 phosphate ABC transporter substrate-binding protein [Ignatzschineria cameli]